MQAKSFFLFFYFVTLWFCKKFLQNPPGEPGDSGIIYGKINLFGTTGPYLFLQISAYVQNLTDNAFVLIWILKHVLYPVQAEDAGSSIIWS